MSGASADATPVSVPVSARQTNATAINSQQLVGAPIPLNPDHSHEQQQQLDDFWASLIPEIAQMDNLKQHALPMSRIKRIVKSVRHVKMVSAETPVVFEKACNIFIRDIALRAWLVAEQNGRLMMNASDVAAAVSQVQTYNFLSRTISQRVRMEERSRLLPQVFPTVGAPAAAFSYHPQMAQFADPQVVAKVWPSSNFYQAAPQQAIMSPSFGQMSAANYNLAAMSPSMLLFAGAGNVPMGVSDGPMLPFDQMSAGNYKLAAMSPSMLPFGSAGNVTMDNLNGPMPAPQFQAAGMMAADPVSTGPAAATATYAAAPPGCPTQVVPQQY